MVQIGKTARETGYQPENHEWRDHLCERDACGRFPLAIPLDVLTAAGHPRSTPKNVVRRLRIMHRVDRGEARQDGFLGLSPAQFPRRLGAIRETVCKPCCENDDTDWRTEARRCAIYDCPAWPYRMGRSPHNASRGREPPAWMGR